MAEQLKLKDIPIYDVNEGVAAGPDGFTSRLPSSIGDDTPFDHQIPIFSKDEYASQWVRVGKSFPGGLTALAKDFASTLPPYTQSFGRISYMPNNQSSELGVLQWPGLPPETLEKLAREMIAPQMVINERCNDVLKYAEPSTQAWRPGWEIVPVNSAESDPNYELDDSTKREIRKAEDYLLNSGDLEECDDPRTRDKIERRSFSKFLLEIVRNSLTFDGIAIWTECDTKGRIISYAPMPAQNIRLLARPDRSQFKDINEGTLDFYGAATRIDEANHIDMENPPFAVAVDETNNIVAKFTRSQLIWYVRNPRVDATVCGYGFGELEQSLTLITGFNNAIQFNADLFDKNSIPKGILAIKGNFTQRQFDALNRIWDNLQRGNRTDWTLPAIQISEKGEIEIINLEPLRKEPAYYNNLINLFAGIICTIYNFPVHRLGFKISGTPRDSRPDAPKSLQEEDDHGLPGLLTHIEILINQYILSNRWPQFKFRFTGKSLREDARYYEARMLAATVDEKRAMVGWPEYKKKGKSKIGKIVGELMGLAPCDPALTGIFQSIIAAGTKAGWFGGGEEGDKGENGGDSKGVKESAGALFPSKKDPAISEEHGHLSGVRRNSKEEALSADSTRSKSTGSPPRLRRATSTYSSVDKR